MIYTNVVFNLKPQMSAVIVSQNDDTKDVVEVTLDGVPITFEVLHVPPVYPLPRTVVSEFCPNLVRSARRESNALRRALSFCDSPRTLVVVPWPCARVPSSCSFVEGAAFVLPAEKLPEPNSFFPLNWRYASGYRLVELEPVVDVVTNATLSTDFFLSRSFTNKVSDFAAQHRGANNFEDLPGFVLADTLKHLAPHAHGAGKHDPLLTVFRPDYASKLKLQADDFIAFCSSEWKDVSPETKMLAGHTQDSKHFYALVKFALPVECVDQLKHVILTNPKADTWQALIGRQVFERAEKLARAIRSKFVTDLLAAVGLQPRKSNPAEVETVYDVFDALVQLIHKPDATETSGIVFYSGCAATHRATRGMLVQLGPDRDSGVLWLHGPPSSRVGGTEWEQKVSGNSLPVLATQRLTKKSMELMASSGWNKAWGFAKIDPIVFV